MKREELWLAIADRIIGTRLASPAEVAKTCDGMCDEYEHRFGVQPEEAEPEPLGPVGEAIEDMGGLSDQIEFLHSQDDDPDPETDTET